jgi:hypothetical protein
MRFGDSIARQTCNRRITRLRLASELGPRRSKLLSSSGMILAQSLAPIAELLDT